MKGLFVLIGESFRSGGQYSRVRGIPSSFSEQKKACYSHTNLFNNLKAMDIECHVFINTYSTPYTSEMLEWYRPWLQQANVQDHCIGYHELYVQSLDILGARIYQYDFVHFIRIDLYLKPYFISRFSASDRLRFSSICFLMNGYSKCSDGLPRAADMLAYVPKCLFWLLDRRVALLDHCAWPHVRNAGVRDKDIDLYVHTYHDSDSQKDWNPLYYVVNRPQSTVWHSKGYEFCPNTHSALNIANFELYSGMI